MTFLSYNQQVMQRQGSHARIHQTIIQLRERPSSPRTNAIRVNRPKTKINAFKSESASLKNSEFLEDELNQILNKKNSVQLVIQNSKKLQDFSTSQSSSFKRQNHPKQRRLIRTSRQKYTSKQKKSEQNDQIVKVEQKKYEQLKVLDFKDFIEEKNPQKSQNQKQFSDSLKAFWTKQHKFVSLFQLQYNQNIIFNHSNILPVYGEVMINHIRYVVSNQYKNSSLKKLIQEFGPFDESLTKIYLRQIISGLQSIHERKIACNRLISENILYNKEGQLFINIVKCTTKALTQKQKSQNLHWYSPQILLQKIKSNSIKNDIWSLGILAIQMMTGNQVKLKELLIHPYNCPIKQINTTQSMTEEELILDNIKQLYQKDPNIEAKINNFCNQNAQSIQDLQLNQSLIYSSMSSQAQDFIKSCLSLRKEQRPNIKSLKSHRFLSN